MLSISCALVAGVLLRLWFIHAFPQIQGDSLLYADISRNWLTHGIYGRTIAHGSVVPTLVRLPGYPAFLALSFAIFGNENYSAILYLQLVIDLATCLLIAGFVRRVCGPRAAMAALWLAVLCPFTANYVAMPLTETLSIFCVALGLYAFDVVIDHPRWAAILALAFAWSFCALLRPDGVLLAIVFLPALLLYRRGSVRIALLCGLLAALPFAAWTARNWHTFHVFQPLAPRSATDPGEPIAPGFQRWTKTWMADFASTYEIYWNVPGDEIDIHALPARALDGNTTETLNLIADYNAGDTLTPQIDARFAALAAERVRAHPIRYYVTLPLLRLADMWFRPRVEMLDIELRWWQYHLHRAETRIAYAYGALNLLYLAAALAGLWYWPRFGTAMVAYVVLRSIVLSTLEAPEPRYTLECFPIVIAFAAALARPRQVSGPETL
jgi:Dolichyl-phosphate-mannose-protein mannosyltransferase